jgi:mannose-6-phosphate isomerase class I
LSSYFGQEPEITTKVLASAMPLSVQLHTFAEMIIPLEKGTAWIGVKENVTAEQLIEAAKEGRIQDVLQEVELETGVPMIVPAYLPHAYGKVRVYEVKAVTPQEDATGTTSFFDRLKYLSPEFEAQLKALNITSLQMTPEQLRQLNPGREKKDVLTMPEATLAETKKRLAEAESSGALNKTNIENLKFTPVIVSAPSMKNTEEARLEVMGVAEGRFITVRYTVAENQSIQSGPILSGRKHTLFVSEGEIELNTDQGVTTTLKRGQDITVTPNMQYYTIRSLKGTAVIYTQVPPKKELPATETARLAAQINNNQKSLKAAVSKGREVILAPNDRTSERLSVTSSAKQDIPQAKEKEVALSLEDGKAAIVKENGDTVELKPGNPIIVPAGMPLSIQSPVVAIVKIAYTESREESASFTSINVTKRNLAAITATGKIDLLVNDSLYQKDGDYANSVAKEQEFWKGLNVDVVLVKYSDELGLSDAADKSIRNGAIPILVGTAENFQKADVSDPKIAKLLLKAKILPPIDLAKIEGRRGWFFTREIEASAILLAATTVQNIRDHDPIAEDLQKLMQKFGLPIDDINQLLCTMSFEELQKLGSDFLDANGMPSLLAKIELVKRLLITLPAKPFNADDDLHRRREVLWSV